MISTKEKIIEAIGDKLEKLEVFIDDVYSDKEGTNTYVHIVLDSDKIIPINTVVMATRIINPIIDKLEIMDEAYILDIYAKSKGDGNCE